MRKPPRVAAVECLEGYRVRVTFSDGFVGGVDLGPILEGFYFEPLKDPAQFRRVEVSHGTLTWPNEADVCPDVLRYYCELGRVCSDEEMNAHFCPQSEVNTLILHDKPNP